MALTVLLIQQPLNLNLHAFPTTTHDHSAMLLRSHHSVLDLSWTLPVELVSAGLTPAVALLLAAAAASSLGRFTLRGCMAAFSGMAGCTPSMANQWGITPTSTGTLGKGASTACSTMYVLQVHRSQTLWT